LSRQVLFEDLFNTTNSEILSLDYSSIRAERILITGSRGMLGTALATALAKLIADQLLECELFLASRSWQGSEELFKNSSVKLISNIEARSGKIAFDAIIHCASPSNITKIENFDQLIDINTGYLRDCISPVTRKVVFISSGEVYGGNVTLINSIQPMLNPGTRRHWYPIAKLDAELFLKQATIDTNLSVDVVRLFHTFGPGLKPQDGRSFADIIYSAAFSKTITLKSDGKQIRSFLFLSDAVSAILMSLIRRTDYKITNVGSPEGTSILNFAKLVSEITKSAIRFSDSKFEHSPFDTVIPDIQETVKLGWSPKVTLADAVSATLRWIKS
jgi:UDP-glucuronate decarboxylase